MDIPDYSRYRSRTFWLCILVLLFSVGMICIGKLDGGQWQIIALGVLAAWQIRQYGDNKLRAEHGGEE